MSVSAAYLWENVTQLWQAIHGQIKPGGSWWLGTFGAVTDLGHEPGSAPAMAQTSTQQNRRTFLNAQEAAMAGRAAPQPEVDVACEEVQGAAQPEENLTSLGSQT